MYRSSYTSSSNAEEPLSLEEEVDLAYRKIVQLAGMREYSTADIRSRLTRKGFSEDAIETALDRALSYRIIDDARYADAVVRSRLATGKGVFGIARELEDLGISLDDTDAWQEHLDNDEPDEVERALAVLRTKPPRSKNLREGAFRKLVQRGFDTATASKASRLWVESQTE